MLHVPRVVSDRHSGYALFIVSSKLCLGAQRPCSVSDPWDGTGV